MTPTAAYTPLEQLLLFQALRHEGTNHEGTVNFSFARISEQLRALPLVQSDPAYEESRLSPDALRELYLWLLKEEVKHDLQQKEEGRATPNGSISRKRKAPSPTLPTVHEAAQHSYLIPRMVTRLYATYREKTVKEIREYESQYNALAREVGEVAVGKQEERLQPEAHASTQSPKPSSSAHTEPALQRPDVPLPAPGGAVGSGPAYKPVETVPEVPPKRFSQATIDAVINHGPEPQNGYSAHRRTSSNTTLPPLSEMAPQSPRFGIPPKLPVGQNMASYMHQPYAHSPPPNVHPSSYGPQHAHPSSNAQLHNAMSRPSSSPRPILPPPPGMKLPHPSPVQHTASPRGSIPQQHYQPQHRSPMGPSPAGERPPHGYSAQLPAPPGYYAPPQYQDRSAQYPQQYPSAAPRYPTQPPQPSHHGGYQLQPWPVDGSQQVGRPQKQQPTQQPQSVRQQQQMPAPVHRVPSYPQYPSAPLTAPRQPPQSRLITDIVSALATPPRVPRRPVWKSERRPQPLVVPDTPSAPEVEPLSPVLTRGKSPSRPQRSARKRGPEALSATRATAPSEGNGRTRRARDRSPHSTVSSVAGDLTHTRTRSQSVSTAIGATGAPGDRPASRDGVKDEPSTPAEFVEAPEHVVEPSGTPVAGPMTRKRRGTLQSQPQPASKRSRQKSPAAAPEEAGDASTPPPRPTTVRATRNFNKVSSSIMNDILSHKHAAYFSGPVRDKDASGYSEIIKQPQHLKSIRAAITAGTRAIAAATATDDPAATPTTASSRAADSSTIELERTLDLIPPKAIVNGAQLEKEVYRMLANAVMFNPGEDGLVADTREMFEDVGAKITAWRGAERDAGVVEEEAVDEGKGKRRKV